jgi:outer membrane protein assembly factor BamB
MGTVKTDGNEITISGQTHELDNRIREFIETEEVIIVNLDVDGTDYETLTQNVIAFDTDGNFKWRIDECPDKTGGGHDAYLGLYETDGGVWVGNLNGMRYKINPRTGDITDKKFVK